jgi:hypothetical protein
MGMITKDYVLSAREEFPIETQRQAMSQFTFGLEVAVSMSQITDYTKELGYLPVRVLFPEHNVPLHPILLADRIKLGFSEEDMRKEIGRRRLYQMGTSVVDLRCNPDFEKQIDELYFAFSGTSKRDINIAVNAIENIAKKCTSQKQQVLEWYEQ